MKRFKHLFLNTIFFRSTKGSFFSMKSVFYSDVPTSWKGLSQSKDLFLNPKWF
jgi:hypothetical protein